ncbi:MAG TPA: DNA repair exonuclease [Thermodesulfovibrionia bacterium]|nr:DNA repair exonuclease [Thermodesulfovibrionia bacterium]
MTPFSFIHAADLHLDSPFKGVIGEAPHIAEAVYSATFDAFESLINLCIEKQVNFLLIAGDVYDGRDRSLRAQLRFRDGLERLAERGISAFVVHGNHDPLKGWSNQIVWPSGVHVFGAEEVETVTFAMDGKPVAFISGISYMEAQETRNLAKLFKRQDAEGFHIGLLHCSVGKNPAHETYAPCTLEDLQTSGFDYWALGHFHERAVLSRNPCVVYPGNIQGRHIREPNERGCFLVQVSGAGSIEMTFYPLDKIRWVALSLSIDSLSTIDQLDQRLFRMLEQKKDEVRPCSLICTMTLTGRGPLYKELAQDGASEALLQRLRESHGVPFAWVQRLEINCYPAFDMDTLRTGSDFAGQVVRVAESLMKQDNPLEALTPVLTPLYGNPRVRQVLTWPDSETLKSLIEEAQRLSLYKLDEEP